MNRILIVTEKCTGFFLKYLINLVQSLINLNMKVYVLSGEDISIELNKDIKVINSHDFQYYSESLDEHRFLEVFRIARENKIDQIHFCRLFNPQRFFLALNSDQKGKRFKYSFSIFGTSQYLRRPIYSFYLEKLVIRFA